MGLDAPRPVHNRLCNLEDFSDPDVVRVMREVFPHEIERFGISYPEGAEYRKHWEVAMAVRSLGAAGVLNPDAQVLGVGAGNEPTIFHLTNLVGRVSATDLYLANEGWEDSANASMLSNPERHWPAATRWHPRRLVVQHMNALDLRYENETFDGVFSSSSIEHFGTATEVLTSLAEIHRVLKPDGVLSISTEFRLSGPPPGLPGILMFDADDVRSLFIQPFEWDPIGRLDFSISDASMASEQRLVDLSAEVTKHVEKRGFIEFHNLDWEQYPHIVLRHEDLVWTSMHLALRKRMPSPSTRARCLTLRTLPPKLFISSLTPRGPGSNPARGQHVRFVRAELGRRPPLASTRAHL